MRARFLILLIFSLFIWATSQLPSRQKPAELIESVATFVCPAKNGENSGMIHLGRKGVANASVSAKNSELKKSQARSIKLGSKARVVTGEAATPVLVSSKSGTWLAATQCAASAGEFWFVGGSADVSSQGYFQFTNENLGKAIIDVELWSEDGSESTRTLTIPPRATKNFSLTTFMPGKKLTVFHVVSRSGLVSANLFDARRKGLTNYGGDYVAPTTMPSKKVIMTGNIGPKFSKKSKISSQKIRILVPGESDAIIQVTYLSPTGIFAPIGLDSLRIPAQQVVEVALPKLPSEALFTLRIDSSEPILAGTITRGSFGDRRELLWVSGSQPIFGERLALPEQKGLLSIVTEATKVNFTVTGKNGKKSSISIPVDAMAIWRMPASAREIEFTRTSQGIFLALALQNSTGVTTTSLSPAQVRELSALPVVDSRLYIPSAR